MGGGDEEGMWDEFTNLKAENAKYEIAENDTKITIRQLESKLNISEQEKQALQWVTFCVKDFTQLNLC